MIFVTSFMVDAPENLLFEFGRCNCIFVIKYNKTLKLIRNSVLRDQQ